MYAMSIYFESHFSSLGLDLDPADRNTWIRAPTGNAADHLF